MESFELDGQILPFRVEMERMPCLRADLLVFRGRLRQVYVHARCFIALTTLVHSAGCITRGKAPSFS